MTSSVIYLQGGLLAALVKLFFLLGALLLPSTYAWWLSYEPFWVPGKMDTKSCHELKQYSVLEVAWISSTFTLYGYGLYRTEFPCLVMYRLE